ncbi:MAG TPA: hypothetical protein VG734_03975 [Lacunisphaera sp.]|nr:hypothetical protein [Lacunisphaera sp.]
MTPRNPTLAVRRLAGACALIALMPSRAAEPSPASPPAAPAPSVAAKALDELEAQAPKDMKDFVAVAASHARAIALVESNTLQTGEDFRRAALLLRFNLNEYRIVRDQYELMLTAAAKGQEDAERALANSWDQLMNRLGRPHRFDFDGWAQKTPDFAEYEPSPACVQAVWRDPAATRAALAGKADSPEIKRIVDADQLDRQGNRANLSAEERGATTARDKARNARMLEIVAAGEIRTANDFARAALVMQHSARFPGFRLAHELAVASMLLGDKGVGRWLVTATYDRMLMNVGLDQRFGTQMGPQGPVQVDEAGICDNQRQALGCPTLAQARARSSLDLAGASVNQGNIVKENRRIEDSQLGVKATYPAGWSVARVANGSNTRSVIFRLEGASVPQPVFYYRILEQPQPTNPGECEALLKQQAADKQADRQKEFNGYLNRAGSERFRTVTGQTSLSWFADYPQDGAKWSEYLVRILGRKSVGLLFVRAPSDQIDALKPALDAMADTVELP